MGDFVIFGAGFVTFVTLPSPPPEEYRFPLLTHKKRYKLYLLLSRCPDFGDMNPIWAGGVHTAPIVRISI